jgi:hypothetical protein
MKLIFYENGELMDLECLSGQQVQSLTDYMNSMLRSRKNLWDVEVDIGYLKDDEAFVTGENQAFRDEYLGKTVQINPEQYGLNPWGTVKVTFSD